MQKLLLGVCIVGVPLTHGWAKEWGLAILFFVTAALATIGATLRITAGEQHSLFSLTPLVIAALACILVAIQLVPLPESVLKVVSPIQETHFADQAVFSSELGLNERWDKISLTPELTRSCLYLAASYLFFILGLWYFATDHQSTMWLLKLVAVSTVLMAVVGVVQLLFGNGKFFGLFENPMRSAAWPAKGSFTNQNHFASFLAVGIGACAYQFLGLKERRKKRRRGSRQSQGFQSGATDESRWTSAQISWAIASVVVCFAAILSFSRGGIAVFLISLAVSCFAFRSQLGKLAKFAVPAVAFCVIAVMTFGADVLQNRWQHLVTSSSLEDMSKGRFVLWQSLREAIPSFLWAGAGAGSHAEIYPTWIREDIGKRFSHAENGYLQIALEMGLPGLILLTLTVVMTVVVSWKAYRTSQKHRPIFLICAAGLVGSLVHSLADFVWYIPACLILTLTVLFVLFRISELELGSRDSGFAFHRLVPLSTFAVVAIALAAGTSQVLADAKSEADWLEYRGLAIQIGHSPKPPTLEQLDQMVGSLQRCLAEDPEDTRAMADLAVLYLQRFEATQAVSDNPMTVSEIRATIDSVGFESRKETLKWMVRAFGDSVGDLFRCVIACRSSLEGQPLRVTSYLSLHQLSFLLTDNPDVRETLMHRALSLRPHDPAIQYAGAVADLEAGRMESGFERLSNAFTSPALQKPILSYLSDAYEVDRVLEILKPDTEQLLTCFTFYRSGGKPAETLRVAKRFAAESADTSSNCTFGYWHNAASVFNVLQDYDREIHCLRKALLYRPSTYSVRRLLALRLSDHGAPDEAETALKACLLRKPDDLVVQQRLDELYRISSLPREGRMQ